MRGGDARPRRARGAPSPCRRRSWRPSGRTRRRLGSCSASSQAMPRRVRGSWVRPLVGEHLDDMGGDVGRRRVDDLAEVAERQPVGERAGVVDVEGAPAPVLGLHAEVPAHRAAHRGLHPLRVGVLDPAQREHHLGGVVDVRVVVVVELERPAAGRELRAAARVQSPGRTICSASIQSAALTSCGWSAGSPASASAMVARQVSQTGDWQASIIRAPSSRQTANRSRDARPARSTGWSRS